jgi:hypothetical protein
VEEPEGSVLPIRNPNFGEDPDAIQIHIFGTSFPQNHFRLVLFNKYYKGDQIKQDKTGMYHPWGR